LKQKLFDRPGHSSGECSNSKGIITPARFSRASRRRCGEEASCVNDGKTSHGTGDRYFRGGDHQRHDHRGDSEHYSIPISSMTFCL
jgi:hypothetical protein